LKKFPQAWMAIVDSPKIFYSLNAEPLKVSHGYSEPMLVRVILTNRSEFDITLGPDGIIRPDLWLDAQQRGIADRNFPGIAYDRMTQQMVLRPKATISQILRIDQGPLSQALTENPQVSVPLS